jgi:hypothetical protein
VSGIEAGERREPPTRLPEREADRVVPAVHDAVHGHEVGDAVAVEVRGVQGLRVGLRTTDAWGSSIVS